MYRQFRIIAAMAAFGLVAVGTGWSPADAEESVPSDDFSTPAGDFTSFDARANADGFRFTFGAPGFVAVDTFIDGGGPVRQSILDGLGNSQSFASLPYPSDNDHQRPRPRRRPHRTPVAAAVPVLRELVVPHTGEGGVRPARHRPEGQQW